MEEIELEPKPPPHHGVYRDGDNIYYFSTPKILREAKKRWGENSAQAKALEELLGEMVRERV